MVKRFVLYLQRICVLLNCKRVLDRIEQFKRDGVEIDESMCDSLYEEFIGLLKDKSRVMIDFNDREHHAIRRDKIVTFQPSFDEIGFPTIILNKYDSGRDIVNNPLIDFELVYDTEQDRDDDIANLRFYLN